MEICIAQSNQEKEAIYRLRYDCYVDEMGWQYDSADSAAKSLFDPQDDTGVLYYAVDGSGVIGATIRMDFGADFEIPEKWRNQYRLEDFSGYPDAAFNFSSRLVTLPAWRGTSVVPRMLMKAYEECCRRGTRFSFCYCRPRLIELYERLGFMRYKDNIIESSQGYMCPMVMLNEDAEHLRRVKSPFYRICLAYKPSQETSEWFDQAFPGVHEQAARQICSPEAFWQEWSNAMDSSAVAVLEGMTEEQVRTLLQAGTVLECKAGDILLREGEAGHEMFLILEGMARFTRRKENGSEWQAGLAGKGDAFGEVALVSRSKRTMSVEAITHLKVLVISKEFLQRAMKAMPEIAMRLLYNLSGVLSQKLSDTTQRLQQTLAENEKLAVLMSKQQSGGKVQAEDTVGGQDRTIKVMKKDASMTPQASFPQMKRKS